MPRVQLNSLDIQAGKSLAQTINGNPADEVWNAEDHMGLIVYNISGNPLPKCAPIPDGIYVWDGVVWQGLNVTKVEDASLSITPSKEIFLPSGANPMQPIDTTPENFQLSWTPTTQSVAYAVDLLTSWDAVDFDILNIGSEGNAAPSGNITNSPATVSFRPKAMSINEVESNPFKTKLTQLRFTVENECGSTITEIVTINQTNKALVLDTDSKEYTSSVNGVENMLKSNADWQLVSQLPQNNNAISNLKIDGVNLSSSSATQTGYEQNDSAAKTGKLTYDVEVNNTKARYSTLVFGDANTPKRFADISLTILQCSNGGQQPTIKEWAERAGFTANDISAVETTGIDSRILPNGIQLHRDQSGNLYLSSNFGANPMDSDERWMIHNLAATKFDTNQDYTGGSTLTNKNLVRYRNSGDHELVNREAYYTPYYAYPNGGGAGAQNATTYNNNPRLGLLYAWDAATAGKGGSTGKNNYDNPGVIEESGFREGNTSDKQKRRQGICPNGWHLPSDDEYTLLEHIIINNKSEFSSLPTSVGNGLANELASVERFNPGELSELYYRGLVDNVNGHGNAMKEVCESYADGRYKAASNLMEATNRPGFDLLLGGYAGNIQTYEYGVETLLWTSSSGRNLVHDGAVNAWLRGASRHTSTLTRYSDQHSFLFSVRCKKD